MNAVGTRNDACRVAWVQRALSKLPTGWRILDAGAGEQRYRPSCRHLKYVSQDFCQYHGGANGTGLQMESWDTSRTDIVSDISAIPEPAGSFDAILCTEVLEHIPDPLPAIREFSRLLRPQGHLILTAPFCSLTHFAPYHYSTGFNRYFYDVHLKQHGFELLELETNGNFFEYVAQECRRLPSVGAQYARTSLRGWERLALHILLRGLRRLSRRDNGSSELLCFGLHVQAVKAAG